MAEIALTLQTTTRAGLADPAGQAVAAADTATIVNDGEVFFRVVWGGTGGTLTVVTAQTIGENPSHAIEDDAITFTAAQVKFLGRYPAGIYNDTTGKITLDPNQACVITAFKVGA